MAEDPDPVTTDTDEETVLRKVGGEDPPDSVRSLQKQVSIDYEDEQFDFETFEQAVKDTDGNACLVMRNVGASPYFRYLPEEDQFERITTFSAPQSSPKHHRRIPRETLRDYLDGCGEPKPPSVLLVPHDETPFPDHPARTFIVKWPRHNNDPCVYGVVTDGGNTTFYFERVSSENNDVKLVSIERFGGDDVRDIFTADEITIPDDVVEVLEVDRNFTIINPLPDQNSECDVCGESVRFQFDELEEGRSYSADRVCVEDLPDKITVHLADDSVPAMEQMELDDLD